MFICKQLQTIITILEGECLPPGLWEMDPLYRLCFVEIQWLHVHRRGIYGYGYIHGYPRENLWIWIWIWIWIWMGNFISMASLTKTFSPDFLRFTWTPLGSSGGLDPLAPLQPATPLPSECFTVPSWSLYCDRTWRPSCATSTEPVICLAS